MTVPLPAWEMKNYSILWKKFGSKEFSNVEAQKELKIENSHMVSVLFYNLKKKGWLVIRRSEKDQRKKVYNLVEPAEAVMEIGK